MKVRLLATLCLWGGLMQPAWAACPYDLRCLNNPFGAGNPYAPNGLRNPYSQYGSPFSNKSWTNPFATNPPALYDQSGTYRGRLSVNPFQQQPIIVPGGTLYVVPAR